MSFLLGFLVKSFILVLGAWLLVLLLTQLHRQIWPSGNLIVRDLKEGTADLGPTFVARWDYLGRTVALHHFFELPAADLHHVAPSLLKEPATDLELKVQGVDVWALIKALRKLVEPVAYTVSGEIRTEGPSKSLVLNLQIPRGDTKRWYFDSRGDEAQQTDLLDQAVFAVIQHLRSGGYESGKRVGGRGARITFETAAAREAYAKGTQLLADYQDRRRQTDLDAAIDQLQTLRQEMPEFGEGLLLLGMALAEDRQEEEAIRYYGQALGAFETSQQLPEASRQILQTQLYEATAYRKIYNWQSAHKAVKRLDQLIKKLHEKEKEEAADADDLKHLRAQAHAEMALTYGLYFVYLRPDNFKDILSSTDPPAPEKLGEAFRKSKEPEPLEFIKPIYSAHKKHLNTARSLQDQDELKHYWGKLAAGSDLRRDLSSSILHAKGYARYRRATWTADSDAEYREECEAALKDLGRAEQQRPGHYAVLLHLGVIHLDLRCEDSEKSLRRAESYFRRSIVRKEGDYFGYEQLALTMKRQIARRGALVSDKNRMEEARKVAEEALKRRADSLSALLSDTELSIMLWLASSDDTAKKKLEESVLANLRVAKRLSGGRTERYPRYLWCELAWEAARFKRRTIAEKNFQEQKGKLLALAERVLAAAQAGKRPDDWEVEKAAEALIQALGEAKSDTYSGIFIFQ